MAGKKKNKKKSSSVQTAKKNSSAVGAEKNEKSAGSTGMRGGRRSLGCKVMPYLLILLAIILLICLVAVHILDSNDGVGSVGYALQWFFGGLFGGATPFLPLVFGYLGVLWCWHNVKWKEYEMTERYADYRKAKKRLALRAVTTLFLLLTVSVMFGVGADEGDLDLGSLWMNGAEEMFAGGGGLVGGLLAFVMVAAFNKVISFVLLSFLLVLLALLTVGITPEYILTKIRERREVQAAWEQERRASDTREQEEAEKRRLEQEKQAAMAAALAKKREKEEKKQEKRQAMSVDEIMELNETEDASADAEPEIYIGPSPEMAEAEARKKAEDPVTDLLSDLEPAVGQDFETEKGFDETEYSSLETFFKDLNAPRSAEQPKEESVSLNPIETDELLSDMAEVTPEEGEKENEEEPEVPYVFPSIDLLEKNKNKTDVDYTAELQENAHRLLDTLKSFKISIKEISYSRGPTITRYELKPEAGVRVRSIANLVDDIALSLATSGVRIEAPIPGKAAVGIEVPNRNRATVYLRDLIDNPQFTEAKSRLTASLGMDVGGNPIYFDIAKMPHMIIAGATGMGKSVCINCIIMSILYKARPEDVKLILVDPKKVEFNLYKDIPHLYAPIVSEPKKAAGALASAVAEMERRFELIEEVGVRDIASYNAATENDPYKEHMPHMVIIIDELADLMMTAPDEVETAICRLAQKARAAGIHIIIGTQRPSVDVITGLIKANIPSRIACTVASQVDSRTIIDVAGAEKLIGRGDMLFAPVGAAKPLRVQGAFVTEAEVENICTFIRENNAKAKYNSEFINRIEEAAAGIGNKKSGGGSDSMLSADGGEGGDSKFHEALKLAVEEGKISTSLMQRRLGVGYGRAAKMIDTMEQMGYVSKPDGNKPRRVLLTAEEYTRRLNEGTLGNSDD